MTVGTAARWVARDGAVVWHGFTQMAAWADNRPVIVDHADGHTVFDVDGNSYLDAISSLWVTTLGHRVPELDQAVRDQLDRVAHTTLLGNGNRIVVELAEALATRVPVDTPHFLFASDGAAAVEQSLRIAFQFWTNRGVSGRTAYLAFGGAYHGDTIGALAVGDGGFGTAVYYPLRFPVLRVPPLDGPDGAGPAVECIEAHCAELAAVVVEPLVQGAAGMRVHEPDTLAAVADACRSAGVLLIADEVATGFGRTGTLFACEQAAVRPDLLCMGKGLTGGYLPMSATAASDRVYEAFLGADLSERTLYHGHSYSGNALAAAVALRHLELLDERDILVNVRTRGDELGALLARSLAGMPAVAEIRRRGLMTGIELAPPNEGLRWGRRVTAACLDHGVLIRPLGDVIVLMPPLDVTSDELHHIVDALTAAITTVCTVATA